MLFVGDILQIPPAPMFQQVPNEVISLRLGSRKEAVLYNELTINERQKSDKPDLLN